MKSAVLLTSLPEVRLVPPNIDRDAELGVQWLKGNSGRDTLRMMGVIDSENKSSTLKEERKRVQDFISRDDQLNWMIEYNNQVVGAVWADLLPTEFLPSPAVHIMVGDPLVRGKGLGKATISAVVDYLKQTGVKSVYSRHLVENKVSSHLLSSIGFTDLGKTYKDSDGLNWQNVSLTIA